MWGRLPARTGWPTRPARLPTPRRISSCTSNALELSCSGEPRRLARPMTFQRQCDQPIQKLGEWNPRGLPHLGVHADGSETGNRVDLVNVDLARGVHQKIDSRHAL